MTNKYIVTLTYLFPFFAGFVFIFSLFDINITISFIVIELWLKLELCTVPTKHDLHQFSHNSHRSATIIHVMHVEEIYI